MSFLTRLESYFKAVQRFAIVPDSSRGEQQGETMREQTFST
jgi:hypothetical protein